MAPSFDEFLTSHLDTVEPLSRDVHVAYWNATISGKAEDFDRFAKLEVEHQRVYTDRAAFELLSQWRQDGALTDEVSRRVVGVLYHDYLRNQIDPSLIEQITHLSSAIVNKFNVFRAKVDGKELTSNEVRKVLQSSTSSDERRRTWEAEKGVGRVVRDDLIRLVKLRNQAARSLGFDNYYSMSLELAEQNEKDLIALFDRLESLTREPFSDLKHEVDAVLAERCGVSREALMPWHYHDAFFQEAPRVFELDLDGYYRDQDIIALVRDFFEGIGLEVSDILDNSDLHEKPGKEQHAYCMDLDRKGDIRVLANVHNDENWTGTMLHELGHAVYDRYIDRSLPFPLRTHAHVFVTEAIAMLFGRLSKDPDWIQQATGIDDAEKQRVAESAHRVLKLAQLVFVRWCQVMVRFERHLYNEPDADLNAVWWDLVENTQMVARPKGRNEPDWASKIHMCSAPVYYHNYMLGELLASQLDHCLQTEVLGSSGGRKPYGGEVAVGEFLKERVFAAGRRYRWDELVERATGEPLNPEYFVDQFVR